MNRSGTVVLAALVAVASRAAAVPATTVSISAPPCIAVPFDRGALVELLGVELRAFGVTSVHIAAPDGATPPTSSLLASVTLSPPVCDPSVSEMTIRVVDRASSKTVERRMVVSDIAPPERPRALAIAIAELLSASLAELELQGAPPPAVEVPPAVHRVLVGSIVVPKEDPRLDAALRAETVRAAKDNEEKEKAGRRADQERAPAVDLAVFARAFPSRSTALLGGMGMVRFRGGEHFVMRVGGDAAFGDTDVTNGSVATNAVTAGFVAAYTTDGPAELDLGPAVHVGYAWASGTPANTATIGRTTGNALVLAAASATLRVHTESNWVGLVGVDLGYTLLGVSFFSDNLRAAGTGGALLGLRAGAGVVF
jgi:hypothetical protein